MSAVRPSGPSTVITIELLDEARGHQPTGAGLITGILPFGTHPRWQRSVPERAPQYPLRFISRRAPLVPVRA